MIRNIHPLYDAPYCGDRRQNRVHDLNNEKADCCIDVIIRCGDAVPFLCLDEAIRQGYDNCIYCLSGANQQQTKA